MQAGEGRIAQCLQDHAVELNETCDRALAQPSFAQSVERLGGARRVDLALTSLMTALAFRPEGFPLVGDHGLRIAKTEQIPGDDGGMIPPLRLYFQIADTGTVVLWWIEEVPLDDEIHF